jgi:hypothetical protein
VKKFIDSEGFKSFLTLLKSKLDRDTKRTSDELDKYKKILGVGKLDITGNPPYDRITDLYNILGINPWEDGKTPNTITDLTSGISFTSSIQELFIELYSNIGKSYDSASESGSAFAIINYLKENLGKSDTQAGTDTAFARIKNLETTTATIDDFAQTIDMDYLFDLYVNHDASTISTEDKNAIITTVYAGADKPDYLD